jgi:hypothetical protein
MSVLGSNLDRIKNILAGNPTAKSKSSVGYEKTTKKHVEGDVWEENGRMWTIKNGIKQNVTKLDSARKQLLVPFKCPECENQLKHPLHKHSYKTTGKCYDCVIKEETAMRINGTYQNYANELYRKNALAWLEEKRIQFEDFINNPETLRGFVTERGDVEDWYGGIDREKIREQFEKEYAQIKEEIEKL